MPALLHRFALHRLRVPLGRAIGDNNCTYDTFAVCALRLTTVDGIEAWGFGEKAHEGRFAKPVSWKADMARESQLQMEFEAIWKDLIGKSLAELLLFVPPPWLTWRLSPPLHAALRMALWDLRGKIAGLPLYCLLGGEPGRTAIAYLSPCCFPQPTEWVINFFRQRMGTGFSAIKIKVGHPDIEWDVARLRSIRETVGPGVSLAVDGNTAWDASTALKWMERMEREKFDLSYVEDPLPPTDLEGYRLLAAHAPFKLVGHDYLPDPSHLRPLLDLGVLSAVRLRDGMDHAQAATAVAKEYGLPLIMCNTFAEHCVHFALAHTSVQRMEFADLGWNDLFINPVRAVGGRLAPPPGVGFGLEPNLERLLQWHFP